MLQRAAPLLGREGGMSEDFERKKRNGRRRKRRKKEKKEEKQEESEKKKQRGKKITKTKGERAFLFFKP